MAGFPSLGSHLMGVVWHAQKIYLMGSYEKKKKIIIMKTFSTGLVLIFYCLFFVFLSINL